MIAIATITAGTLVTAATVAVTAAENPSSDVWTARILGASTLLAVILKWISDERKEKRLAEERRQTAAALAAKTESAKVTLASKIDENTQINVEALNAANNVNTKMAAMNQTAIQVAASTAATVAASKTVPMAEEILAVSKDTNKYAHTIKHAVVQDQQAEMLQRDLDEMESRQAKDANEQVHVADAVVPGNDRRQ